MQKIKIMALIIMILISGLAKSSSRELSPEEKAYLDIEVLSQAVELYHSEFGSFPTNEQGLDLLSQEVFVSKNFPCKKEKLISKLPLNPWGRDYLYLVPGINNPEGFDIWTNGKDGLPGGTGVNRGCGNWDNLKCGLKNKIVLSKLFFCC
ncbi:type II secretion system protein GspG [Pseudoalteromonas gelatinilytica]